MEYKNIFITGATGVVGKPLLQKLIKNNHNIYALARSEETMKDLTDLGVSPIKGDLFESSLYDQLQDTKIEQHMMRKRGRQKLPKTANSKLKH